MRTRGLAVVPMLGITALIVSTLLIGPVRTATADPSTQATIDLAPATDLVDQLQIRVSGSGFPASATVAVHQCGSSARSFARCGAATEVTTDGSGSYWTWFRVNRSLVTRNG